MGRGVTDALVAASREAIARGSKSFALASRLFDGRTRDRATLLYAWCRYADDVIDGQVDGFGRVEGVGTPAERLAALEAGTRAALAAARAAASTSPDHAGARQHPWSSETGGRAIGTTVGAGVRQHDSVVEKGGVAGLDRAVGEGAPTALPFAALARVAAETDMPDRYPLDLLEGFRSDVEERVFVTYDDTLTYCYYVAGCVGVMMAIAMGVPPGDRATLDRACDLGIAFQLDNIARDVIEDAANGRCYLPAEWLREAGLTLSSTRHPRESGDPSPEVLREMGPRLRGDDNKRGGDDDLGADDPTYFAAPANRAALATVVARLVDAAERYAESSRYGTPALPWRSAWAVLAAADIYGGIGRRVRAEGAAALDRRVTTTTTEKLAAVARALPAALSRRRRWPAPGPSRAGLWTMPTPAPL